MHLWTFVAPPLIIVLSVHLGMPVGSGNMMDGVLQLQQFAVSWVLLPLKYPFILVTGIL